MKPQTLTVTRLGQRGDGVAHGVNGPVYLPYVLPTEVVLADVDGDVGHVVDTLSLRPDRVPPICPYFETCGGCAVQSLKPGEYAAWKHGLVTRVLEKAGIAAEVAPVVDAHGEGRRRATFHARMQPSPNILARRDLRVGFMRARAHEVVDLAFCPILSPGLGKALPAARALADAVASLDKPLDLVVTATQSGLDVDLRGLGRLDPATLRTLSEAAVSLDLARLANHGDAVLERWPPVLNMGRAQLVLPPGAFLQATARGEEILAELVQQGVGAARRVVDLFCGLGTFALRLAETATVRAVDLEGPSLSALGKAARATPGLRPVTTESRDLFLRPLAADDLDGIDAVVFDPPRAGANAQAAALAASKVPIVVAVSCNPATFARDAAILIEGGYALGTVTPVDQFRYAPHIELVAVFRRAKARPHRSLFG